MEQGIRVQEQKKVTKKYYFTHWLKSDLIAELIYYHVGLIYLGSTEVS